MLKIGTSEKPQNMAPMGRRCSFIHCPQISHKETWEQSFPLNGVCTYVILEKNIPDNGPCDGASLMATHMVITTT